MASGAAASALPRRLVYRRDLLRELLVRDIKLRYKRSVLGVFWTLVNPLAQLLVFDFVFRVVFQVQIPNYTSFLFIGIVAWSWFNGALLQATNAILENRDLIRLPGFPAATLPNVTVASHLLHFLLTLPILVVLLLVTDVPLTAAALFVPVVIVLQYVFTLGLAYLVATLHVTFRDTQYLLGIFLMLGFYLTPILYDVSTLPERYQPWYRFNLLADIIDAYRAILLRGELPEPVPLLVVAGVSVLQLLVFRGIFQRASTRFAEEL